MGGDGTDYVVENTTTVYTSLTKGYNGSKYVVELSASDAAYMMNGATKFTSGTDTTFPVKVVIQNTAGGKWVLGDIEIRGI